MRSKADKVMYYGVVNIRDNDPFAQLATSLTAKEQEYFHRLVTLAATTLPPCHSHFEKRGY